LGLERAVFCLRRDMKGGGNLFYPARKKGRGEGTVRCSLTAPGRGAVWKSSVWRVKKKESQVRGEVRLPVVQLVRKGAGEQAETKRVTGPDRSPGIATRRYGETAHRDLT